MCETYYASPMTHQIESYSPGITHKRYVFAIENIECIEYIKKFCAFAATIADKVFNIG